MFVLPSVLVDVISVIPAIRPSDLSRGVATVEAMVSGLAPGKLALTCMVGNSTWGKGATGNKKKASAPDKAIATVINVVAMGRYMKGLEILIKMCLSVYERLNFFEKQ